MSAGKGATPVIPVGIINPLTVDPESRAPQTSTTSPTQPRSWGAFFLGISEGLYKLLVFLAYAVVAFIFLITALTDVPGSCYVRNTFKQDFLTNIHANPFFLSTKIFSMGPRSGYEVRNNLAPEYKQTHADVAVFPVMHMHDEGAFIAAPSTAGPPSTAAGANPPVGLYAFDGKTSTFLPATGSPSTAVMSSLLGAMMNQQVPSSTTNKDARVQGNFERCLFQLNLDKTSLDYNQKLQKAVTELGSISHKAGTCLLTAQQPMVEVSSNYQTSLVLFSSVNLLFLLAVVLWISASFALFYFAEETLKTAKGQVKKVRSRVARLARRPEPAKSDEEPEASWYEKLSADGILSVGVLWNFVLIAIIMFDVMYDKHIPVNNVVLCILLLLLAITKQIQWANFVMDNDRQDWKVPERKDAGVGNTVPPPQSTNPASPWDKGWGGQPEEARMRSSFQTINFFPTAKHVNQMRSIFGTYDKTMKIATGGVFATDGYAQNIQENMQVATVQNIEYTITTSLLYAGILASYSSIVPTGMVQTLFANIVVVHIAARACIKASKMGCSYKHRAEIYDFGYSFGTFFLWVWCLVLTISCMWLEVFYYTHSDFQGELVYGAGRGTLVMMATLHGIFCVATFAQAFSHFKLLNDRKDLSPKLQDEMIKEHKDIEHVFELVHSAVNLVFKMVVAWIAMGAARSRDFANPHCNLWGI